MAGTRSRRLSSAKTRASMRSVLAGERSEALHFLGIGDLYRPAVELQGVVHEASPVHRLDDGGDLVVLAVGAGD